MAKIMGAYVTTISSDANLELCKSLGADVTVSYSGGETSLKAAPQLSHSHQRAHSADVPGPARIAAWVAEKKLNVIIERCPSPPPASQRATTRS